MGEVPEKEEEWKEREECVEANEQWSNGERRLEELRESEEGFEAVRDGALSVMDNRGETENEAIILFSVLSAKCVPLLNHRESSWWVFVFVNLIMKLFNMGM